jgi:hypothetical protein
MPDNVSKQLYAARREAIKAIYFELGADRSFKKLAPIAREKFGGPSLRTIMEWSRLERWPEAAQRYDTQRAALQLQKADELIAVQDIDEAAALQAVARRYLHQINSGVLGIKETKDALACVESSLRMLRDLTGDNPRRRLSTVNNHLTIVDAAPSPAIAALAAFRPRMLAPAEMTDADAPMDAAPAIVAEPADAAQERDVPAAVPDTT